MDGFAELCDPWARISERKPYVRLWKWEKGGAWTREKHATVVAMLWTVCDSGGPDALKHMPFDSCSAVIRCWLFLRRAALSGLKVEWDSNVQRLQRRVSFTRALPHRLISSSASWLDNSVRLHHRLVLDCEHRFCLTFHLFIFFLNHDVI